MKILPSNTKRIIALYRIGDLTPKETIDWATSALELGNDSQHVCVLAGYSAHEAELDLREFRSDFEKAIKELELKLPPYQEAHQDYVCFVCHSILDGSISCRAGHKILYALWNDCNNDPKQPKDGRLDPFMYLDDSMGIVAEGYPPILERFGDLTEDTYPAVLAQECRIFIDAYCTNDAE